MDGIDGQVCVNEILDILILMALMDGINGWHKWTPLMDTINK